MENTTNPATQPSVSVTNKDYWKKAYREFLALSVFALLFGLLIAGLGMSGNTEMSSFLNAVFFLRIGLSVVAFGTISLLFKKHIRYAPIVAYVFLAFMLMESLFSGVINIVLVLIVAYLAYISYKASKTF